MRHGAGTDDGRFQQVRLRYARRPGDFRGGGKIRGTRAGNARGNDSPACDGGVLRSRRLLEPHGLYLVDSGGQYLFGTTDITRTVPMGPCTPLEREDYTLVLKGHIQLAMAVFPRGTTGCHLDILAREPLWLAKRNFGHGTGHGIGFFLNVHEGPQEFRQNFNSVPFQPGIINTNEPGLYREGMHGVRHENAMLCRAVGDNEFGSWLGFEPLTLCHFDTSCLELGLLTQAEKDWLNAYHRLVWETLSPRLEANVAAWLREKTRPV